MKKIPIAVLTAAILFMTASCGQETAVHNNTLPKSSADTPAVTETPESGSVSSEDTEAVEAFASSETTTEAISTTTVSETTSGSEAETASSEITEAPAVSSASSSDDTTVTPTVSAYSIYSDTYKSYTFGSDYKDFISKCVFVGDSICSGLKAYSILPAENVCAVGNVAARNIFEDWVLFKVNGSKLPLLSALKALKPEYVVFSMGMNDVNMTSESVFCKNYESILSQVEKILPNAKLIVLSITPITYADDGHLFTYNSTIDKFNAALKKYLDGTGKWIYADVAHEMKNTSNMLKSKYLGSLDGVHLAPDAYYAILHQLCERVVDGKIYEFDGTFSYLSDADDPAVTTAPEDTAESTKKTKKTKEPAETTAPEETTKVTKKTKAPAETTVPEETTKVTKKTKAPAETTVPEETTKTTKKTKTTTKTAE